jgi:cysteine sulfinate desulfinase/cysteine desulfurase-like protein
MTAMGLTPDWGLGSLRVTVGNGTTIRDVETFLAALPGLVAKARGLSGG